MKYEGSWPWMAIGASLLVVVTGLLCLAVEWAILRKPIITDVGLAMTLSIMSTMSVKDWDLMVHTSLVAGLFPGITLSLARRAWPDWGTNSLGAAKIQLSEAPAKESSARPEP
jgi:hypothetical protein